MPAVAPGAGAAYAGVRGGVGGVVAEEGVGEPGRGRLMTSASGGVCGAGVGDLKRGTKITVVGIPVLGEGGVSGNLRVDVRSHVRGVGVEESSPPVPAMNARTNANGMYDVGIPFNFLDEAEAAQFVVGSAPHRKSSTDRHAAIYI